MQHSHTPQPIDDLALQNAVRKRYNQNWPAVIVELTKRVQAVNAEWQKIMTQIMFIDGLRVSYAREGDSLVITVSVREDAERHEISMEDMRAAKSYIEVLVMDKLSNSKLIAKHAS